MCSCQLHSGLPATCCGKLSTATLTARKCVTVVDSVLPEKCCGRLLPASLGARNCVALVGVWLSKEVLQEAVDQVLQEAVDRLPGRSQVCNWQYEIN